MFKNIKFWIFSLLFVYLFFDTIDAKIKRKGGSKSKDNSKEISVQELEQQGWITNKNVYPSGSPEAKKGGMITMLGGSEYPSTFRDIGKDSRSQINSLLGGLQYEALLSFDYERLEWAPNLATHWKISADSLTYWFRLNPKAKFLNVLQSFFLAVTLNVYFDSEIGISNKSFQNPATFGS